MGLWDWIVGAFTNPVHDVGSSSQQMHSSSTSAPAAVLDESAKHVTALLEPRDRAERTPEELVADEGERWWRPADATLIEPPGLQEQPRTADLRALENLLVSHFDGHDLSMPPLQQTAQRVMAQLRKKKTGFSEVAKVIADDQVMAAALLRMANSPLYRGLHKTTTLQNAITRLGAKALHTLMMHQSLRAITMDSTGEMGHLTTILWSRSVASGCIMRKLGPLANMDEDDAFLTGLLHDIGNVIVLRVLQEHRAVANYELDLAAFDYLCHESHQEFGELIAIEWKLPEQLTSLISCHHSYPDDDDPLRTPRLLLQVTDMANSLLGYTDWQPFDLMNTRAVQDLGLADRREFTNCLEELPEIIRESIEML